LNAIVRIPPAAPHAASAAVDHKIRRRPAGGADVAAGQRSVSICAAWGLPLNISHRGAGSYFPAHCKEA
jgi:hypothetical protein